MSPRQNPEQTEQDIALARLTTARFLDGGRELGIAHNHLHFLIEHPEKQSAEELADALELHRAVALLQTWARREVARHAATAQLLEAQKIEEQARQAEHVYRQTRAAWTEGGP